MKNSNFNRFHSLVLKNKLELKNRVVVPAMASQTANSEGFVTERTVNHYRRLAESQAGLIFLEYSYVLKSGKSESNQLGVYSDLQIPGLSKVAKVIKTSGALAGIQLTHAGGKSSKEFTGGILMGPSAISVPVKGQNLDLPTPMTYEQIEEWIEAFVAAAIRAKSAGFDVVELHSAHGYGLNQWISPLTNQRSDDFGSSLKNRMRILEKIISQIKKQVPDILISVRIPGQDHLEGGLSSNDATKLAKSLESFGVDILNVSSGIGGWRRPRDRVGEGYLVAEAAAIQKEVNLPVIGVGGIESGAFIDELIEKKTVSLAAVGRAILNNPAEWAKKNLGSCESNCA